MGEEKLSGGMFEREAIVADCNHCGGDTICQRGGYGQVNLRGGGGVRSTILSCNSCVTAAQLPYREEGYENIMCSACKGKGKIVL